MLASLSGAGGLYFGKELVKATAHGGFLDLRRAPMLVHFVCHLELLPE